MQRTFDVRAVREQFPALGRTYNGRGVVYLDGPGGSQVPEEVIAAIADHLRRGTANDGGVFATSRETIALIADARRARARMLASSGSTRAPT